MRRSSILSLFVILVAVPALLGLLLRSEISAGSSRATPRFVPLQGTPSLLERACFDLADNDSDGLVDCDDPDCARTTRCRSLGLGEFTLANEQVAFRFVRTAWDFSLESIRDLDNGFVLDQMPGPMWRARLRAADGTKIDVEPGDVPSRFSFEWRDRPGRRKALLLYWQDMAVDAETSLDVTVHFVLRDRFDVVNARIDVGGTLGPRSLFQIDFPRLDTETIDGSGETRLLYPSRKSGGGLIRDPEANVRPHALAYPTNYQLQLAAYYDAELRAGLYFTCDDGEGRFKRFLLEGRGESMLLAIRNLPSDNVVATAYSSPYRVQFGPFEGDWYDAARLYRRVARNRDWMPPPIETRTDIPDELRFQRLNLFLKSELDHIPEDFVPLVTAYRDRFGLESLIALYRGWDTTGDETGRYTPDHLPPKPGLAESIAALRGIPGLAAFPLPATGSIGYDPRTPSWAEDNAVVAAYKDEDQNPVMRGVTARMDACTDFWREKQRALRIDELQMQIGAAGSYFDSFVVTAPCYDPAHGHPVGGGRYIHDCIREWLAGLLAEGQKNDPAYFLAEEPPTENFLDLVLYREGYFCVAPVGKEHEVHVPLFQAVYHEFAPTLLSSKIRKSLLDDGTFTPLHADLFQAHGFAIGNRLNVIEVIDSEQEPSGWLLNRPELVTHFEYLERLVEAQDFARKYLAFGELLRPLASDVPRVDPGLGENCHALHEVPVVESSVWRASDGTVGLVFTNWTAETRSISYGFALRDYGLDPGRDYVLARLDATGETPIDTIRGDFARTETLAPKGVLVLVLR